MLYYLPHKQTKCLDPPFSLLSYCIRFFLSRFLKLTDLTSGGFHVRTIFVVLACLVICVPAFAQSVAQIIGTVKDSTGAVLPGVDVKVTQTDTGVSRTTIT